MTKTLNSPIYRLINLLLAWYLLSGCAAANVPVQGDVWGLFYGSARYIVDGAMAFEPFTRIYTNPGNTLFVFARPIAEGWGWVITDGKMALGDINFACGNYSCAKTWTDLVTWMEENGWMLVGGGLTTQIQAAGRVISSIELAPIFVVIPAGMDPAEFFLPEGLLPAVGTVDG